MRSTIPFIYVCIKQGVTFTHTCKCRQTNCTGVENDTDNHNKNDTTKEKQQHKTK